VTSGRVSQGNMDSVWVRACVCVCVCGRGRGVEEILHNSVIFDMECSCREGGQ